MTQTFTITPEQGDEFKRVGILQLDGLLLAEGVRRAREAVCGLLSGWDFGRPGPGALTLSPLVWGGLRGRNCQSDDQLSSAVD